MSEYAYIRGGFERASVINSVWGILNLKNLWDIQVKTFVNREHSKLKRKDLD